ncbi:MULTISPECIES: helix-turn-helix domain-containing protein [Variovorax]|jgi:tetratricopeptide (TPR) repeat protein|uniref:helix-turn-helix domain-containing protein n=1 Tax=Variovorax TaxID=34072 RepID=UPI00086E23AB|nr:MULTISPECIES: helix-turn-helix domain-containing protein [Variovorax]MBN8754797.1 helix-turn-helix domain-containing protein [Variovorax sp.]ODU11809.1 MAG: DNA-binding protein [Variovorax sp. SCN 67-85]ODV14829.1 MAG: DNA-binding protein [Variovorax sp. SCN 67-20]OJZ05456.1 MAG: DNA-binding protein [Variovorax sp. 67-131]UKI05096.1 helix-turn-helix domain-containing protein [Variovorax paradoxus]
MDSLIAASARALAAGDVLGALKRVALREDPPALALRGIAMAQLGEHPRARELLRRAARDFGAHEETARARCVVAEAEVAMAMRDLGDSPRALAAAAATLEAREDHANALQARLIAVRRLLLLGRLDEAAEALARLDARGRSPSLAAVAELTAAELALRSLHISEAQGALARAQEAAEQARVPALLAEVAEMRSALDRPAARRLSAEGEQTLRLGEVAALLASDALVVDACRRGLGAGDAWQPLARRPVLFSLARALAEAWPGDIDREALIECAFRTRRPDETHRARLRVEIGRLRALVRSLAGIEATARGFVLKPRDGRTVAVLAPPIDGEQASLVALLSDGAAWSTSALALAVGASQRTVQRALAELEEEGRVRSIGQARARRWLSPPLAGFTTILLLPSTLPIE